MKITAQDLREQYESLATEELIELYMKNELTELASSVLVQILKERGVSLENVAELAAKEAKKAESSEEDIATSFLDLADYFKQYESLETEQLIELCKESELNELALSAISQILEYRRISRETLKRSVSGEEPEETPIQSIKSKPQKKEGDEFLELLIQSNPRFFVTKIIVTLNILVFAVMAISGVSLFAPDIEHLLKWGANFGPLTVNQWWRLFSSTFVHIGVIHLLFNMWCLWSLGKLAERMFGSWTFLMFYVLSGLGGSIASLWWHPRLVSAGASGAIFGVAGGLIAFFSLGKLRIPRAVINKNLSSVLLFVGYNVFYGFTQSGIDNAAHLGGLFVGSLIGGFLHRPLPPPRDYSRLRHYIVFSSLSLSFILGAVFIKTQVANDPVTKLFRAAKLTEAGDLDQAIVEHTKAIELDPRFAAAYNDRGVAYEKKGQFEKAISDYNKAIDIDPKLSIAYYNRGIAYGNKGQHDKAISDFSRTIELNPKDADAFGYRGNVYTAKGQYDKAISDYNKALEINPNFALAYNSRGVAYANKGELDQAISDYNKAIEINPKYAKACNNRGHVYERKNFYDRAISDYRKAMEIDPRYAAAYNSLAWLLATCPDDRYRNGVEAIKLGKKALEMEEMAYIADTLAAAYAEAGRFEEAIMTQEKAITLLKREGSTRNAIDEYVEHLNSYKANKPWREK